MRYPYHARIRQRIRAGELSSYYFTEHYPRIGAALVLVFTTVPPLRPIRPEKWALYLGDLVSVPELPPPTPQNS